MWEWIERIFFSPGHASAIKRLSRSQTKFATANIKTPSSFNSQPSHTPLRTHYVPMQRKLSNEPVEFFRTLPHGIKLKIYRFTVHVFDSRQQLIEAVDLFIETRYASPRGAHSTPWPHRPIGEWDVSGITDFSNVFSRLRNRSTEHFNEDISQWNVSNATNLSLMFYNCPSFNADISQWNVSNATDLSLMFCDCRSFNADISQWSVSNATNLSCMFYNCRSFNADISRWNVSNATELGWMFSHCPSFNADLSQWNVSNATDLRYMFSSCRSFNQSVVAGWPISPATRQYLFAAYEESSSEDDDDDNDEMTYHDEDDNDD
jgi:surface protein